MIYEKPDLVLRPPMGKTCFQRRDVENFVVPIQKCKARNPDTRKLNHSQHLSKSLVTLLCAVTGAHTIDCIYKSYERYGSMIVLLLSSYVLMLCT